MLECPQIRGMDNDMLNAFFKPPANDWHPHPATILWVLLETQRRRAGKRTFSKGSVIYQAKDWLTAGEVDAALEELVRLRRLNRVDDLRKVEFTLLNPDEISASPQE